MLKPIFATVSAALKMTPVLKVFKRDSKISISICYVCDIDTKKILLNLARQEITTKILSLTYILLYNHCIYFYEFVVFYEKKYISGS